MSNVKIVTDSNSGITQTEAKQLGISVIPMPFLINDEEYLEDINLTQEEFYQHLEGEANVSTSQPAVATVTELWDALLAEGEDVEIIHIPMSSGLSESCHTAMTLSKEYHGRVHVIDNQRISVTQKSSVLDALKMLEEGKSAAEIESYLMKTKFDSSIYIALDTLKYLKKGGRLTPAAALVGSILRIKPVLQIQGEKLDAFKKVHSLSQAKQVMIEAIRNDLRTRFADYTAKGEMKISIAHTNLSHEASVFKKELEAIFPAIAIAHVDPLSLSVSCHIGPGALAVTVERCY